MAGGQNTGCVLYVGTGGDVKVTTAGNDIVTFVDVQNGSFLPVQVVKVEMGVMAIRCRSRRTWILGSQVAAQVV